MKNARKIRLMEEKEGKNIFLADTKGLSETSGEHRMFPINNTTMGHIKLTRSFTS